MRQQNPLDWWCDYDLSWDTNSWKPEDRTDGGVCGWVGGFLSLSHGCHTDRCNSSELRKKNKHTNKQINATHHDLTTSGASMCSVTHGDAHQTSQTREVALPLSRAGFWINRLNQSSPEHPKRLLTLRSPPLFYFMSIFLRNPSFFLHECVHVHALPLACSSLGLLIHAPAPPHVHTHTPYPSFPGCGLSDGVWILSASLLFIYLGLCGK